jgi:signal transduction histidine kinase
MVNEFNGKVLDEDQADILIKFSRVFEQAYIRFLDLQKAEKSAREIKIELSLERIRSQVTAMQESSDLFDIVVSMRNEFISLGHEADYFWHMRWSIDNYEMSMTSTDGNRLGMVITVPKFVHEQIESLHQWEKSESPFFILDLDAKGAWDYIEKMNTYGHYEQMDPHAPTEEDIHHIGGITFIIARTTHGEIGFSLSGQVPDPPKESIETLVRFAKVFDLAYRRFEDLKSAEAQIREAQIEAGLEKLRGRAMAMHRSEELLDLVALFFQELVKLDMELTRCLIWTFNNDRSANWWMANPEDKKKADVFLIPFHTHPTYLAFLDSWEKNKKIWEYDLSGELKRSFDKYLFEETELINLPAYVIDAMKAPDKVILTATFNHFGVLQTAGLEPLSDENKDILKRFGMVFDQTYTRFLDLQLAERQTYQAKIETALERVRARAMAMQEPEELKEVAQVLRVEMGSLGIEELETCSIYIIDKKTTKAECWYALKDIRDGEKKLVNDHFHLDLKDTWVGREMLEFYANDVNKVSIVMKGSNRKEWIDYCEKYSEPFQGYYGKEIPERTYHLYKFTNGAIGFASAGEISDESWSILVRAAAAFSLAFSRFQDLTKAKLDLIKLKKEKKRAEDALSELQLTQAQLIHAEKMASLGELTAGIAHEIQNPLNFVNNFSEVSTEMIVEANEEMERGDVDEVKVILKDLKGNLEKITHHGKRAESIVRGMLMHSRASNGEKILTDINVLCDEFLRLSYHGLRAKDRTFNAEFETRFDQSIPKIEIVPQDIGRVLLNLINNAFQACSEVASAGRGVSTEAKPLTGLEALSEVSRNPKVIVETKLSPSGVPVTPGREGQGVEYDQVQIIVSDNGPGIPDEIKSKIFQPFFTTKPTGQGTGLGLSLAYDIVKAHGGELQVSSSNSLGTCFMVLLPK